MYLHSDIPACSPPIIFEPTSPHSEKGNSMTSKINKFFKTFKNA